MNRLSVSLNAQCDLIDIEEYIKNGLINISASRIIIIKIVDNFNKLLEFPYIGSKIGYNNKYRYILCKSYHIYYSFSNNIVHIARVLSSKIDCNTLITKIRKLS